MLNYRLVVCKKSSKSFRFWIERKDLFLWKVVPNENTLSYTDLMNNSFCMLFWLIPKHIKKAINVAKIREFVFDLNFSGILLPNKNFVLCQFTVEKETNFIHGQTGGLIKTIS